MAGGGAEGYHPLSPGDEALFAVIAVLLTLFAGLMSGLVLGLFSLDKRELEVRVLLTRRRSSKIRASI